MGGHVPLAIVDVASALGFVRAGRVHPLGVTGPKRAEMAVDIPTIAESGVPGFYVQSWFGVVGPAGMPPEIVKRLNAELKRILQASDVRERFFAIGFEPAPTSPEEFGEIIRSETSRWAKVIKEAGILAK
jgi:tripartite-type tricarboxylate transporter receptor subunit TctC